MHIIFLYIYHIFKNILNNFSLKMMLSLFLFFLCIKNNSNFIKVRIKMINDLFPLLIIIQI